MRRRGSARLETLGAQVIGMRPILVGRFGAAVVHALAALPWVVLIEGVGLSAVEPELEESARLEMAPLWVLWRVSLRRTVSTIAAAALAVAVLTAGDMTVTDLLQCAPTPKRRIFNTSWAEGRVRRR